MVGFIVLKKESTYICATCRKCMNAMKNYTYHLVAVLTVGIWGLTFISTKVLIGHGLSPQEIFLLRFLIAYMGIWLISPRKLFADNWKDEFWMFLGGMTGGSFYFFTENTALEITLATNVSFIVCTAPLLTTILSLWIYKKEKATRGLIGGSLLALVGVALVVYNGSFVLKISPLGDFLTLLAAFSWAFYSLIMRKMSNRYGITFITRKSFSWSTSFNLSHYRSEIVDVGLYDANGKPVDDVASKWFIGEPINVNYDYKIIGVWQIADPSNPTGQQDPNYRNSYPGYVKYLDVDGNDITTADKTIIGSAIPKVNMSLMNTFEYKNFTLSVFLTAQLGQTHLNALYDTSHNSYRQNRFLVDFWTPENPTNSYPKNSLNSDVNPEGASFYEKTDFLRISDVTLGYNFPQQWLRRTFIKRLNLYMNIKNLATITGWTGMDPEFLNDQLAAPPVRSFTFGLKLDI